MKILKVSGIVIGILIGVIVLYLAVVIFGPGFDVARQPLPNLKTTGEDNNEKPPESRTDVSFKVDGIPINAWLYLPENLSAPVPCVVMSHGFGGTKDMALETYAVRYQEAGLAILTYDYRHFGASKGEPRQLFSSSQQVDDLRAAINYVRGRKEIDPNKIALWGTSAAGGYGLVIAAQDKKIACIIGQCPALDSHADSEMAIEREGIGFFIRLFVHAQRDKGRSRFGLSPHTIPIVGKPGTLAMLAAPGALDGYAKLASPGFKNRICARVLLETGGHNPIDHAKDVQCPVLLQICEKDNLVSMSSVLNTARILGNYAEVKQYPIGHFDIYVGDNFEKAIGEQIAFLKKHLKCY
jgi:fermentation-respiration switch protein FrsA (DUF1100 family)